jgi:hypothetical protein
MGFRKPLLPRFESLESKALMSAGVATAPIVETALADHGSVAADPLDLATVARSSRDQQIALTGQADGAYTTTQGTTDAVTHYHVTATGTIIGVGAAVISGSFRTPWLIHGRVSSGTLSIMGSSGTLTLRLTASGAGIADASANGWNRNNAGGSGSLGSTSISAGPIVLLNDFKYTIIRGTGHFAHTRGSGTVLITTTPGFTVPTGPGIYNTTMMPVTGSGRTTLTFR